MQKTFKLAGWLISALMATLFTSSADAGLKYWTTGNYDAGSYVQDGLVLHYDGIRNVGINQPHSTTTTTWVNLGSAGSAYDVERQDTNATGAWTENAFKAAAKSYFRTKSDFVFPVTRTMQACFIPTANTHAYIFSPVGDDLWQRGSFQLPGTGKLNFNAHYYKYEDSNAGIPWSAAARPETACANSTSNTATAFLTPDYATITLGTTRPTSGNRSSGYVSLAGGQRSVTQFSAKANIMGNNGTTQLFNGTLFAFRFYNRILDNNELVWNRAVDETRYFGAAPLTEIPVTNVVVASTGGNDPIGEFAVDSTGYTFFAPATRNDGGLEYALDGYTIETWDAGTGTWGAPVDYSGASYTATDSGKVRLTWKWHATTGLLTRWNDAAYGIGDYVQEGLILHFDGIRNAGADAPHDNAATVWRNIAPNGGLDLLAYHYTGSGKEPGFDSSDTSVWTADGFWFSGNRTVCDLFYCPGTITVPAKFTMQILVDANTIDQQGDTISYPVSFNPWNLSGIGIRRREGDEYNTHSFYLVADKMLGDIGSQRPRDSNLFCLDYGTAMLDVIETANGDVGGATFFTGTNVESRTALYKPGMWAANGWQTGVVAQATSSAGFAFGGNIAGLSGKGAQAFTGKIKSFRLYNRILSDAELSRNRIVDDARFFGGPSVTNVEVATTFSFLQGAEEAGFYGVRGAYTFTCPETTATVRGIEYALDGYTIETWDATYGWNSATAMANSGASYTYTEGVSPAKVRLTWRWKPVRGRRTAADYTVEDCVANGLDLHYDGICNVGKDSSHDGLTRVWRNLARPGCHDLKYGGGTINWNADGHAFNGSTYFAAPVFTFPFRDTFQSLLNADPTSQPASDGIAYWFFPSATIVAQNDAWQRIGALSVRTSFKGVEYAGHGHQSGKRPHNLYDIAGRSYAADVPVTWVNAAKDETRIFVTPAATNIYGTTQNSGAMQFTDIANAGPSAAPFYIGGPTGGQRLRGTLKNFRHYDRVLTNEELVRNRNVDSARYFGELGVTNVFVVAGGEGAAQTETGAYKVEGEWTFTATKTVNKKGDVVDVTRYSIKEPDGEGGWTNKRTCNGNSYTYTEGTSPATVRLEWLPDPMGMVFILK